ncbi:hypothetical protein [Kitasatospora sp. NPDC101183]|uniref:hypothetical protein n=1 Tax=Kitasatospora sp. NPDC101183 TaxID=3364100 RepID=UPI0037F80EC1
MEIHGEAQEPQGALVNRLLAGQGTRQDAEAASRNFDRWMREAWGGREDLAMAHCVNALAGAWGGGWSLLPERDSTQHVWLFTFLCPSREELEAEAEGFVAVVRGSGGSEAVAHRCRLVRGIPG